MREAKLEFEKDIINKCASQPKLFFNYIIVKLKVGIKLALSKTITLYILRRKKCVKS